MGLFSQKDLINAISKAEKKAEKEKLNKDKSKIKP